MIETRMIPAESLQFNDKVLIDGRFELVFSARKSRDRILVDYYASFHPTEYAPDETVQILPRWWEPNQ